MPHSFTMPYRNDHVPMELDRSILVVGLRGRILGLDRSTGVLRWENKLGLDVGKGAYREVALEMRYGAVIVSGFTNTIYRIDYQSGNTLWKAYTSASGPATIVIEADCVIVAKDGYLDCFSLDGESLWKQPLSGKGHGSVALGFPGNVQQAE